MANDPFKQTNWSCKADPAGTAEQGVRCPRCKGPAEAVKAGTVKHLVLADLAAKVNEGAYYICLSEGCYLVYFDLAGDVFFWRDQIKLPVWYKKDADPKYICYCNQVTEQQIIDAVLKGGAKNIKDVARLTGAMRENNCELNNPLGRCCLPVIQSVIDRAISAHKHGA